MDTRSLKQSWRSWWPMYRAILMVAIAPTAIFATAIAISELVGSNLCFGTTPDPRHPILSQVLGVMAFCGIFGFVTVPAGVVLLVLMMAAQLYFAYRAKSHPGAEAPGPGAGEGGG